MVAAAPLFPVTLPSHDAKQRILLQDVPSLYVALRDAVDSGGVRMTYLRGSLEIMITSHSHEVTKKPIARLSELFCLERSESGTV